MPWYALIIFVNSLLNKKRAFALELAFCAMSQASFLFFQDPLSQHMSAEKKKALPKGGQGRSLVVIIWCLCGDHVVMTL